MFQHKHKSGISFEQAKKDAKKAAKKGGIQLSKAQDDLAFAHSRSTWAQAVRQAKMQITFNLHCADKGDYTCSLNETASVSLVAGDSGAGKTIFFTSVMSQLLRQGIPVTYMTYGLPNNRWLDGEILHALKTKYSALFNVYDVQHDSNVESITLNGGVLFVDELEHTTRNISSNLEAIEQWVDLFSASKHTFISTQRLYGCDPLSLIGWGEFDSNLFMFRMNKQCLIELRDSAKLERAIITDDMINLVSGLNTVHGTMAEFVHIPKPGHYTKCQLFQNQIQR